MSNNKRTPKDGDRIPIAGVVVGDVITVRGKLALLGWPSMRVWARAHGYPHGTVRQTVYRWGMRDDRPPHGGIARAVMRDLRNTLETAKRPDQATSQGA